MKPRVHRSLIVLVGATCLPVSLGCLFAADDNSPSKNSVIRNEKKGRDPGKKPLPSKHIFGPLVGKRVVLDALVWHYYKGLSGRILLPGGTEVYLSNSNVNAGGKLKQRLPQGKLVRAVGVLKWRYVGPAPPGAQGYGTGFSYFSFKMDSFKVISRAEHAFPKLVKGDGPIQQRRN